MGWVIGVLAAVAAVAGSARGDWVCRVARLAGRVPGGSTGPLAWSPFLVGGFGLAGQGAWGRAVICCQAAVMSPAQGQVAGIRSWRRRAPRTSRAAACRTR